MIFNSVSNKIKGAFVFYEILNLIGLAFFNFAVSLGPVSLVSATAGIQSIFVLILASLLSLKIPGVLKEELNKKVLLQKIIAIILIIAGAGIIVLY